MMHAPLNYSRIYLTRINNIWKNGILCVIDDDDDDDEDAATTDGHPPKISDDLSIHSVRLIKIFLGLSWILSRFLLIIPFYYRHHSYKSAPLTLLSPYVRTYALQSI